MYDMITYTYFCLCGKTNCRDVYRNSFIRPLLFLEKVFERHFDAPKKARLSLSSDYVDKNLLGGESFVNS